MWTGELKVEKELNAEITTAFPVTEALPTMEPGVYLLAAQPGNVAGEDYGERTTQWFIVSDLGLTAFSGTDGIHAFVNSLATTAPVGDVELRLLARNNEVLAVKKTDAEGTVTFEPGLARGEGGFVDVQAHVAIVDGGDAALRIQLERGRDGGGGRRLVRVEDAGGQRTGQERVVDAIQDISERVENGLPSTGSVMVSLIRRSSIGSMPSFQASSSIALSIA